MNVIILGPPGAGKGTQADLICKELGIVKISTGDMLRASMAKADDLANKIKGFVNAGQLVPDELILAMLKNRISEPDCKNGFLLDGFPRTLLQAEALEDFGINIDSVIVLEIADEEIVRRLSGRRVHAASGRTYHVDTNPPKVSGVDDITGEPLTQRVDDNPETIRKRLEVYHAQTQPLIKFYKERQQSLINVDAAASIDDVTQVIMNEFRARL